jgi:hypothetical protein
MGLVRHEVVAMGLAVSQMANCHPHLITKEESASVIAINNRIAIDVNSGIHKS